jgi:hypothetical protein
MNNSPLSTALRRPPRLHSAWIAGLLLQLSALSAWAMNDGSEGPWGGFPRTQPTSRYENDPGADLSHHFGVTKAFSPYQDPDINEARRWPSPLDDSDFDSYNLIVVISKSDDNFWGREQTLRVYKRGVGLLYYNFPRDIGPTSTTHRCFGRCSSMAAWRCIPRWIGHP